MVRPTYDDLREEDQPGTLERERLERLAPTMQARIAELETIIARVRAVLLDPALEDAECCNKIRELVKA